MAIILEPISFIGLDIGQTQARVIQLNHATEIPTLVAAGSIAWEQNIFEAETDEAKQTIADKIKQLIGEVGIVTENAIFSLPESEIFTRIIELPKMAKDEIAQAIHFEAESYVPYPLEEVQLDWQILEEDYQKDVEKMHALLVAAPLKLINNMVSVVELAGLRPLAIETNCIACNRSLTNESPQNPCVAIADMGSTSTELCISDRGTVRLTHNIPVGGDLITEAIAKELSIEPKEAEKLKTGLTKLDEAEKSSVTEAFSSTLESIFSDLKRTIDFYHGQPQSNQITQLITCGQGSKLDGIQDNLSSFLNLPVVQGNPWEHVQSHETLSEKQMQQMTFAFAVAIGLAMRKQI